MNHHSRLNPHKGSTDLIIHLQSAVFILACFLSHIPYEKHTILKYKNKVNKGKSVQTCIQDQNFRDNRHSLLFLKEISVKLFVVCLAKAE